MGPSYRDITELHQTAQLTTTTAPVEISIHIQVRPDRVVLVLDMAADELKLNSNERLFSRVFALCLT